MLVKKYKDTLNKFGNIAPLDSELETTGRKVRTYSFDDIEAANMKGWLRSIYEDTKDERLPLLNKWRLS